jgi:hypothetical protein
VVSNGSGGVVEVLGGDLHNSEIVNGRRGPDDSRFVTRNGQWYMLQAEKLGFSQVRDLYLSKMNSLRSVSLQYIYSPYPIQLQLPKPIGCGSI